MNAFAMINNRFWQQSQQIDFARFKRHENEIKNDRSTQAKGVGTA